MTWYDVIIVGGGPTGLLLASELALQGIEVAILERLAEPDATIKSGSINVASAEILDRRGLLPEAEAVQRRLMASLAEFKGGKPSGTVQGLMRAMAQPARRFPVAGHFAGMLFRSELVDQADPVLAAHLAVAGGVLVPQYELELLLAEHCRRLGVTIHRGVEVSGVRDVGDELRGQANIVVESSAGDFAAGWVVAADGGRSAIRKQLDIEFIGTAPEMVGYQAIADIENGDELRRGWTWTSHGIYAYGPIPGRILAAKFGTPPENRDAPVTREELEAVVQEVTEIPVKITRIHGRATRWSDNARQAAEYRRGRVFLAGDAAHVHSPFSGQGLNLGLGDAVNLGWKLAATIKGWAPEGLLDTYHTERHPIAAWVLDWTRAQVALMRGDERTRQLRRVVGDELLTVPGAMNRVVALSSGILQSYDVAADAIAPTGTLVGDVELAAGGRLADRAHDGRFVLVDRSADGRFADAVRDLSARVGYVPSPLEDGSQPSLLVRPDGIVAWAARQDAGPALDTALRQWGCAS